MPLTMPGMSKIRNELSKKERSDWGQADRLAWSKVPDTITVRRSVGRNQARRCTVVV